MNRVLLIAAGALAGAILATHAHAKPRACTNAELRNGLTDAMVIGCTGKNGTVKCDRNGTVLCCKKLEGGGEKCVDVSNLNLLRVGPAASPKPPAAPGAGPAGGKLR